MIERMKKVTVVCLEQAREHAVDELARLGSVHVTPVTAPASEELDRLLQKQEALGRAQALLLASAEAGATPGASAGNRSAESVVRRSLEIDAEKRECLEAIGAARKSLAALAPWGSFSRDQLVALQQRGLHVTLCRAAAEALPELPEGAVMQEISRQGNVVFFALVTRGEPPQGLPAVNPPEQTDGRRLELEVEQQQRRVETLDEELRRLAAGAAGPLAEYGEALAERIAFAQARDGMGQHGQLSFLSGYLPENQVDALREAAAKAGWGLRLEDAAVDDRQVPVKLRIPRIFEIARPIFQFVGILPGYNECDVSVSVLLFLTLFFGMIVGDAGYGMIFLVAGLVARARVRTRNATLWANLFLLLSVTTVAWGALNGTWFAIPETHLPRFMRGLDWLTDSAVRNRHIQWICFLIGAIHLSMARLWRAALGPGPRQSLGYLGWAMLIWGNFFTAVELIVANGSFPRFAFFLYGGGLLLVLSCGVNWRDVGGVMNLPFDIVGSFVDVLSYIRLFAVGLSSYYIADSFNDMGRMVFELSPWLLPVAILVIAFGHVLNVLLAFMGVLVHGVRLNTLEFSNHMQLTWSGRPYKPLKRRQAQSH